MHFSVSLGKDSLLELEDFCIGLNAVIEIFELENPLPRPAIGATAAALEGMKAKTIRPEKMREYKGESEGEHIRWFREFKIKAMQSPEYFLTDKSKILFCMVSLVGDPSNQWYEHITKNDIEA